MRCSEPPQTNSIVHPCGYFSNRLRLSVEMATLRVFPVGCADRAGLWRRSKFDERKSCRRTLSRRDHGLPIRLGGRSARL